MKRSLLVLLLLVVAVVAATQLPAVFESRAVAAEVAAAAKPGDITMVSSDTCPYCKEARAWFTAHKVPFKECFVERDSDCATLYAALQSPGTPVLVVRDRRQVGFDPRRIAQALLH